MNTEDSMNRFSLLESDAVDMEVASPQSVQGPSTSGVLPNACPECRKVFSNRGNLNKHLKVHLKEKNFKCVVCQKEFTAKTSLDRHMTTHNPETLVYTCSQCPKTFGRKDIQRRHEREHTAQTYACHTCGKEFGQKSNMMHHERVAHLVKPLVPIKRKASSSTVVGPIKKAKRVKAALGVFSVFPFTPSDAVKGDLKLFEKEVRPQLLVKLEEEVDEKSAIKWYPNIKVKLTRTGQDGEEMEITVFLNCKCKIELVHSTIPDHMDEAFIHMEERLEKYTKNGSGWVLSEVLDMELHSAKYHPLVGRSYIPTPPELASKKAILNVQNFKDNKCLVWSLLAHKMKLGRKDNPERLSNYESRESDIQLGNLQCPIPHEKMGTIEHLNNLRINVYIYDNQEVEPVYVSKRKDEDHIDLMLIANDTHQHYVLIRSMSRLLGDLTGHHATAFYCPSCLHRCTTADILKSHESYCNEHRPQKIYMPEVGKNDILEFKNEHYSQKVPFTIYADFESLLAPTPSSAPSDEISHTEKLNLHKACSYGFTIIDSQGKSERFVETCRDTNPIRQFIQVLLEQMERLGKKMGYVEPLVMTKAQEDAFQKATICNLCKKDLGQDKVRDHCHRTGRYRQALHNACNLNYKESKIIPVVFHNLRGYDSRHIMLELGNFEELGIEVIATGMENYISFRIYRKAHPKISLRFIDSFQFMNASLEKLASTLDAEDFKIMKEQFEPGTDLSLLTRKGIYPYEYMDSHAKFEETSLPPLSAFYSTLTNSNISEQDYKDAQEVWDAFPIHNLGDYHDLYLKTDVLLLADIFEKFRAFSLEYYHIDPCHVMTAAGLAWQAFLKMNEQPLELLTDIDQHLFIERGIRGGISMISQRFAKANNPEVPDFDPASPISHLMYLDANNLYGWSMSQPLPCGGFEWEMTENITPEFIQNLEDDDEEGYILEVDLKYPQELHDLHNEYPLAAEKLKVTKDMLSPYAHEMLATLHMNYIPQQKLSPNLLDKKNYVIHYRNLKYYLNEGLQMTKVHKALKFKQSSYLKKYIKFNTDKRAEATTAFEKDFFKLMNNAIYGKTMENLRNRIDIQLVNNQRRAKKLVASPSFKSSKIFHENFVGVERFKTSILLNRPIYAGFAILELSKLHMYQFHYNFIKKQFGEKAKLCFTDTDSLMYHIETPNIYKALHQHKDRFDFSDYTVDNKYRNTDNKKVIGKFKDELNGEAGIEFIGLRPKMYSLLSKTQPKKTAKGISRAAQKLIAHDHYKESLQHVKASRITHYRIGQEGHQLYTYRQRKIGLSPFDDKRYILDDGIHSWAYGHYRIPVNKDEEML